MPHRPMFGARITETDVLERESLADRIRKRARICGRRDLRLDLEEREQVVQIQRLARDRREAGEEILEERVEAPEGAREEREVADREVALEGAPDDVRVGDVIRAGADRREDGPPSRAAYRDLPVRP